jgi:protein-S-isoprenylcysteine O-methyltransferase Ste14
MYAGITLAAYSFIDLVTGIFVILLFVILPFRKEPWLRQQYVKSYEEYCKKVPRFIGLRSFKTEHMVQGKPPVT